MDELGELLKTTRENTGVSIKEVSADLKIKELSLENIEAGKIGCFKDIFVLKEYIYDYAKYLGLNPEKVIDDFNEYMFEYTSKIPLKDIEKAVKVKQLEEKEEKKISSPYTLPKKERKSLTLLLIYILSIFIVIAIIIWSIKQITVNNEVANKISMVR